MANNENLKPFTKGDPRAVECGKKSKRKPLHEKLQDMLESGDLDKLLNTAITQAKHGDMRSMEFVFDRAYGKAKQEIKAEITADITTTENKLKDLPPEQLALVKQMFLDNQEEDNDE